MAAMTLLEAAKQMEPSRKAGIIQLYAEAYHPLQVAPVIGTGGRSSYTWSIEDALAHTSGGKRNINADFTASEGQIKPYETDVKIYGGKIQVDRYIQYHSPASVAFQEASQIRSNAREFTVDLFEGSGGTSLRGFRDWMLYDGAFSGQQVDAGSSASGDLLTTMMVDDLLAAMDVVMGKTYFYCTQTIANRLRYISKGQQSNEVHMFYTLGQFGQWDSAYASIPVIVLKDGKGTDLLSAAEIDGATSQSNTCSFYAVTWGEEMAALVSSNSAGVGGFPMPMITKMTDGTNYNFEAMEWYVSAVPHRPRSIGRIRFIKNSRT
jgi:hypothetical protein